VKLTVYQLEISAPALGPCATDDFGALYFHPELVNPEANSRAVRQRVLAFFHVEEDLVGLCPMSWVRAIGLEPEQRLNLLESFLRRGIDAVKKGRQRSARPFRPVTRATGNTLMHACGRSLETTISQSVKRARVKT
jgi:hypothetical protein